MKKVLIVLSAIFLLTPSNAFSLNLSDFETPESMQVDTETGAYYISNINGEPLTKDGNGYISKITANGNTVIRKFIGGKPENPVLNAPKGLVIVGKDIFVTDIDVVKAFDKESGKLSATIDLTPWNAKFLNDIAVDSSNSLYVSDMFTNRIFKIDPSKNNEVTVFKESPELGMPNGVVINPKTRNLMVVTWGSGQILEIDPAGHIHVLKRGLKGLDGIDYDSEGNLYVSSFEMGEVYRIPLYGRGALSTFLSGLVSPADISCDRAKGELLVPSSKNNDLRTYPLEKTNGRGSTPVARR